MSLEIKVGPPQLAIHQGHAVLLSELDGQINWPSNKGLYSNGEQRFAAPDECARGDPGAHAKQQLADWQRDVLEVDSSHDAFRSLFRHGLEPSSRAWSVEMRDGVAADADRAGNSLCERYFRRRELTSERGGDRYRSTLNRLFNRWM